jgi:hypothetical protein
MQVCQVLDQCLMFHLDVFFHRHTAVVIACAIYIVAKVPCRQIAARCGSAC